MKQSLHLAAIFLLVAGPVGFAQQTAQPSQAKPASHDNRPRNDDRPHGNMDSPGYNIMPEGMPPAWWHNHDLSQKIGLTADQQKRMDDIFSQNKQQLGMQLHERNKQRDLLQAMLDANPPDTAKILPQLDRMAQARATLEVAWGKVLLSIRTVLTPDQWNKLQAENRHWKETHPNDAPQNHNDDHRNNNHDRPNFQGKPGGGAQTPQSNQPPA